MTEPTTIPPADPEQPAAAAPDMNQLLQALDSARAEAAAAKDAQLRALADVDNTRRRLERELATGLKYAAEKLLGELLAVVDSLEMGLKAAQKPDPQVKALADGMELTYRQLMAVLEKQGVRQLDPKGEPFNPDAHQAMTMTETTEVAPNHVLAVMQKGYKLHDRLLRPAMVVVARAPAAPAPPPADAERETGDA